MSYYDSVAQEEEAYEDEGTDDQRRRLEDEEGKDALKERGGRSVPRGSFMAASSPPSTTFRGNRGAYEEVETDEYDEEYGASWGDRTGLQERSTASGLAGPLWTAPVSDSLLVKSPRPGRQAVHGDYMGAVGRLEETVEDRSGLVSSVDEGEEEMKALEGLRQQRKSERSLTSQAPRHSPSDQLQSPRAEAPLLDGAPVHTSAPDPASLLNLPKIPSQYPSPANSEWRLQRSNVHSPKPRSSTSRLSDIDSLRRSQVSSLPPQLRARLFFERTGRGRDYEGKDDLAVNSLENTPGTSAYGSPAPFVDEPITDQVGSDDGKPGNEVHSGTDLQESEEKKPRNTKATKAGGKTLMRKVLSRAIETKSRPRSTSQELERHDEGSDSIKTKITTQQDNHQQQPQDPPSFAPDGDNIGSQGDDEQSTTEEDTKPATSSAPKFTGPPATLLEELDLRKALQKQRNRTSAAVLPTSTIHGRPTTLLEQDAIARIQKHARKQKHITLAWEDQDEADKANFSDEDVPLGVLYAGTKMVERATYPMGLLERRLMEDNEPLSQRRARLLLWRGGGGAGGDMQSYHYPPPPAKHQQQQRSNASSMHGIYPPPAPPAIPTQRSIIPEEDEDEEDVDDNNNKDLKAASSSDPDSTTLATHLQRLRSTHDNPQRNGRNPLTPRRRRSKRNNNIDNDNSNSSSNDDITIMQMMATDQKLMMRRMMAMLEGRDGDGDGKGEQPFMMAYPWSR